MAIKLIIDSLESGEEHDDLVCEQSLMTFGRSKSCTVELNNHQISEHHFLIRFIDGRYILMDEGSTFGTMLDGEMLETAKIYELQEQHHIVVPGFTINVFNDGHAPRLERTLVVARKLMGQILQGAQGKEQFPRLEGVKGAQLFLFSDDRSSFVLGSSSHVDFIVPDDVLVAKEHVSFIRDIFGVRCIPITNAKTKVGPEEIMESRLLKHGDVLLVGCSTFIFKEHPDDSLNERAHNEAIIGAEIEPNASNESFSSEPKSELRTTKRKAPSKLLDGIFIALFALVSIGAVVTITQFM